MTNQNIEEHLRGVTQSTLGIYILRDLNCHQKQNVLEINGNQMPVMHARYWNIRGIFNRLFDFGLRGSTGGLSGIPSFQFSLI